MSCTVLTYDDCCLLASIDLNSERIFHLLERRLKSNSTEISFDFKSFLPEQPSNNVKVSRSLLRCQPKLTYINDYEDTISSDSSSSVDDDHDNVFSNNDDDDEDDDDRLNKLAEWEPSNFQPMIETDDDEEEDENIFQSIITENINEDHSTDLMDLSPVEEIPTNSIEDLLVTYIHRPVKTEPISHENDDMFDNPPQLDGQIDLVPSKPNQNNNKKNLDDTIARIVAKTSTPNRTIRLNEIAIPKTKFRLNDDVKKKSTPQTPKKSAPKIDRPKEPIRKETKPPKKTKTRLLSSLLKINEDIIRPLQIPIPTNTQKMFRLSSDTSSKTIDPKAHVQRKSLSMDERKIPKLPKTPLLIHNKQKSLSQDRTISGQSKEKSALDHMTIAEKKLNHFQKHEQSSCHTNSSSSMKAKANIKNPSQLPKTKDSNVRRRISTSKTSVSNEHHQLTTKKVKKLKRLDTKQSTHPSQLKQKSMEDSPPQTHQHLSPPRSELSIELTNSNTNTSKRPSDFFEGCITIDDDEEKDDSDIQEIERQSYSIDYNIRSREKLLDHIVHSPAMHVKWLFNLDSVLLEHISICHANNIRPLNTQSLLMKNELPPQSSVYQIDPSFISTIIINFLKLFILRNSSTDQQNVSFIQFGFTSHLRYLLIELPTYNHTDDKDLSDHCSQCHQYSLIINILFDLLFDLMEYDLCGMTSKMKYRSSLIEDDYFTTFAQTKILHQEPFYRIKLLIYFIELIGIHIKKCPNRKQFQFNQNETKFFHSIEDFIRHIFSHSNNSINQRMSICFNVIELCLLFVNEKKNRIKQMAVFLAELCENNPIYVNIVLLEKNLLVDIRLLLINELIGKKFNQKLVSIDHIRQFFLQIHETFNSINSIDEFVLLLLRSLFNTYADFILEIKSLPVVYSNFIAEMQLLLHHQLEITLGKLIETAYKDSEYFEKIKSNLFFYRLLKCKWNQL